MVALERADSALNVRFLGLSTVPFVDWQRHIRPL
jgi:hypothetical protein